LLRCTGFLILLLNFNQLPTAKKKDSKTVHLNKSLVLLILTEL
jgi:hypothetical protein